MSSEGRGKREASRNDGGAAAPTSKRQKSSIANHGVHQSNPSFLLDSSPEILGKVYSFLFLKEALILRQVHRHLNDAANGIYQYSIITSNKNMRKDQGFEWDTAIKYMQGQHLVLCNISNDENLRAVLLMRLSRQP